MERSIPRFPRNVLSITFGEFNQIINASAGIIASMLEVTVQKIVNGIETVVGTMTVNGNQTVTNDVNVGGSLFIGGGALEAIPIGAITAYAGPVGSIPPDWLLCNGAGYDTTVYADLFAVTGYTYGGAGATFNVPDLRGRVAIGPDGGTGRITISPTALGDLGGENEHALTVSEMTEHIHNGDTTVSGGHTHSTFPVTGTAAGDGVHVHPAFAVPGGDLHLHSIFSGTSPVVTGAAGATQYAAEVAFIFSGAGPMIRNVPSGGSVYPSGYAWTGSGTGGIHTHTVDMSGSTLPGEGDHQHPVAVLTAGSDTPHNNMMPNIVINYIIKT